ncbi:odorant receptor 49a-like isoform X2 [Prorops nasuta]|uniref:odorant receptor 49a-like isoform X2 n=1 Tax=Prorops nasuta TaxID=863751 RepID=UPI0034CFDBFB
MFLILSGQWPSLPGWFRFIRAMFYNVVLTACLIMQFAGIVVADYDKDVVLDILPVFAIVSCALGTSISLSLNMQELADLWYRLCEDWAAERNQVEDEINREYSQHAKLFSYFMFIIIGIPLIIMIPVTFYMPNILDTFIPLNETRRKQMIFHGYAFVEEEIYISQMLMFSYLVMIEICIFGLANTAMFCVFIQQICGMFAILCHRLEYAIEDDIIAKSKNKSIIVDVAYRHSIVLCIERHQKATEFVKVMETYYGASCFIIVVGVVVILSPTLYQLTNFQIENYKALLQIIVLLAFFFIVNFMCQRLINVSSDVPVKAYFGQWYRCSREVQSLIILLIRRSIKPCRLSAYGFFEPSLDCFRTILQTGLSYFMVLREM